MANTVTIRELQNMPGFFEFDYKITKTNQRVRRKIQSGQYEVQLLKDLLENVLADNLDEDAAIELIRTNSFYNPYKEYLEDAINSIYYSYIKKEDASIIEIESMQNTLLNTLHPLSDYKANYCFLGKAGVGKSTIIRKMSPYWNKEEIPFPFTDTSRTTTFQADYCFVPKKSNYKFVVILNPQTVTELHIGECIERAINKMIELELHPTDNSSAIDEVFNAFVTDPTQTFDIRYSLGRYIKTTSPAYNKPENQDLISFWRNLYAQFRDIIGCLNIQSTNNTKDALYYKLRYADAIKGASEDKVIYDIYEYILQLINKRMSDVKDDILKELESNPIVHDFDEDISDSLVPYISCKLDTVNNEDFYRFIQVFTTKHFSYFGKSMFNIVKHLRIELPLNPAIKLPRNEFSFVIQDTIGIAHSNESNGGFENSTSLRTDNLDAVVLIDDSRLNGDNNITAILQHLAARMDINRISFAFTFFDELKKADFDEEDDIDEQRKVYLRSTEANAIRNTITDPQQVLTLTRKLETTDTIFMSKLMSATDFSSVQELIDSLIGRKLRSDSKYEIYKTDDTKDIVIYDYRKIPLLYGKAVEAFTNQQDAIYYKNPPHFKTTEALTNRLSRGITSFHGARLLTPVDDLYNAIIVALSSYIDAPMEINFVASEEVKSAVVNELKAKITEELRGSIKQKFFTTKAISKWKQLYMESGTGSDLRRRNGIISTEKEIAPDIEMYISGTAKEYIIDTIESAFRTTISKFEEEYHIQ